MGAPIDNRNAAGGRGGSGRKKYISHILRKKPKVKGPFSRRVTKKIYVPHILRKKK